MLHHGVKSAKAISTHAPVKERRRGLRSGDTSTAISTHAPVKERLQLSKTGASLSQISTHAPVKERLHFVYGFRRFDYFNSRSCEGATCSVVKDQMFPKFQLTLL